MDNKIIPSKNTDIIQLMHTNKELFSEEPFARDILLFETHVAGTMYINEIEDILKELNIGDRLNFYREQNNDYDENAVVVKTLNGVKIGYIPKKDNIVFSRLMDAGKLLFGQISDIHDLSTWTKISMEIYLHE